MRAYRKNEQPLRQNASVDNATSSRTSPEVGQIVMPRDGNPLSHFLSESSKNLTVTNEVNNSEQGVLVQKYEQECPANPAQEEVDFDDLPVHARIFDNPEISDDPLDTPFFYPFNQESRRLEISDDANYNYVITQNAAAQEKEQYQSRPSLSDTEDTSIDLGIDFDSPEIFERRLMREIFNDKKERARHFQLMELEAQRLQEERQQLEQIKADIEQKNYKQHR